MAKPNLTKITKTDNGIFQSIEDFRNFCVEYGYRFDEADLNNMKSYAFQQYSKFASGKRAKNMWEVDASRLNCNI